MRTNWRRLLPAALVAVFATSLVSTPAQAAGEQFNLSATSGRPGAAVVISQDDPCPAAPDALIDVYVSFTDAAGVRTDFGVTIAAVPAGTWNHVSDLRIPVTAAQGTGTVEARCTYWDGTAEVTSLVYTPKSYTVAGTPPQFTRTPTSVQPGETVSITAVDSCPGGDLVAGAITGSQAVSHFRTAPDSAGMWTVDVPASSQNMDGTRTPFPPGAYTISVGCSNDAAGRAIQQYVDQQVTVGTAPPPPPANCKDGAFFAVAGSGQAFDGATNLSISPELQTVFDGFKQRLKAGKKFKLRVINYPALPVAVIGQGLNGLPTYLEGKNVGVNRLAKAIAEYREDCPGKPIVAAGFSQGALVVHEHLVIRAATTSGAEKQAITAAVVIANPARRSVSQVVDFGDAPWTSRGICHYFEGGGCFKTEQYRDIPQVYRARTKSVCNNFDVVCDTSHLVNAGWPAPGDAWNEGVRVHTTSYPGDANVNLAGKSAAQKVNQVL